MKLQNLRVRVQEVTDAVVELVTEQNEHVEVPRHLLPDVKQGEEVYIAVDNKPLVSSEKHAKDVLNELIKS